MAMDGDDKLAIVQCGRQISKQEIEEIKETVNLCWRLSRYELAQTVSEHLQWYTASGSLKVDACLKLLDKLQTRGVLRLPEKQRGSKGVIQRSLCLTEQKAPQAEIVCELSDLGPIELEVVNDKQLSRLWNQYVSCYHYLGYKKPFGYYLRYFIKSQAGRLGCILFSGAAKRIGIRDKWIGWTEKQRLSNLSWVINNSRFLIFPWVRVKNLASHVLGQISQQVSGHFHQRWGFGPVLMETFVDPRYVGSCYKASNWQYLGMTTGQGLVRAGKSYTTSPKKIFVKPLAKNYRQLLCSDKLVGRVQL